MTDNRDDLPRFPIDVLETTAETVRLLHPDIQRTLGGIATIAYEGAEQDWVNELTDAADKLQGVLDVIYDELNGVNTRPEAAPQKPAIDTMKLSERQRLIIRAILDAGENSEWFQRAAVNLEGMEFASKSAQNQAFWTATEFLIESGVLITTGRRGGKKYQLIADSGLDTEAQDDETPDQTPAYVPTTPEPAEEAIQPVEEATIPAPASPEAPSVRPIEKSYRDISPNESSALDKVLEFLAVTDERVNISIIIRHVFGRARLPKSEEQRFMQLLDGMVIDGQLRYYGKSYGLKSDEDQRLSQSAFDTSENADNLDEAEAAILEFIAQNARNGEINIGQIVREYYQQREMNPTDFQAVASMLNDLATRGHLLHAYGSPWYGIADQIKQKDEIMRLQGKALPAIVTPVKAEQPIEVEAPSEPVKDLQKPIAMKPDETVIVREPKSPAKAPKSSTTKAEPAIRPRLTDRELELVSERRQASAFNARLNRYVVRQLKESPAQTNSMRKLTDIIAEELDIDEELAGEALQNIINQNPELEIGNNRAGKPTVSFTAKAS